MTWESLRTWRGESHPSAKLTNAKAQEIYQSNEPAEVLAARHGVSIGTIQNIWRRKKWRQATESLPRRGEGKA